MHCTLRLEIRFHSRNDRQNGFSKCEQQTRLRVTWLNTSRVNMQQPSVHRKEMSQYSADVWMS